MAADLMEQFQETCAHNLGVALREIDLLRSALERLDEERREAIKERDEAREAAGELLWRFLCNRTGLTRIMQRRFPWIADFKHLSGGELCIPRTKDDRC